MGLQQGLSGLNGWRSCAYITREKSVVSPKKKTKLKCSTHPRGILGVYDFLHSDESNRSYSISQK